MTLDLDMLDGEYVGAEAAQVVPAVFPAKKAGADPAPAGPSAARKAGLLAGGVGLIAVGLALTAAPIVVAVLIVRAVTK